MRYCKVCGGWIGIKGDRIGGLCGDCINNPIKIILDLGGGTGAWSKPYKDAGCLVYNVTLPEYDITKWHIKDRYLIFYGQNCL